MNYRGRDDELPFKEGTWFAIPLQHGGYGVGRVARRSPKGVIILAYFFGPKREHVPSLDEVDQLEPHEAVKILKTGDLGLLDGTWPIIGDSTHWEREKWPIPGFIRRDEISRTARLVIYSDDDPNSVPREKRIPYDTPGLEPDRSSGYKAAEEHVSRALDA